MSNTTSIVNLNPEKVKNSLTLFDDIENDVNEIKTLTTITKDELSPKDFYDGVDSTQMDTSVLNKYVDRIGAIKDYVTSVEQIDNGELVTPSTEVGTIDTASGESSPAIESLKQSMQLLQEIMAGLSGKNLNDMDPTLLASIIETMRQALNSILTTMLALLGIGKITNQVVTKKSRGSSGGGSHSGTEDINIIPEEIVEQPTEVTENVMENPVEIGEDDVEAKDNNDNNREGLVKEIQEEVNASLDSVNGNKVVNKVLDANGNVVAVSTINNGKKTWYQVSGNKVITPDNVLSTYKLGKNINITDNGQVISINAGEYPVEHVVYNADGSIKSVRLNCGNYRLVLGLNQNGDIDSINYIKSLSGVFSIDNTNYDIYDSYGNIVGKYNNGQYYIYETMYSETGDVVGFRLSPDGEYEQWLYVNGNTLPSEYSLFETKQTNEKTSVSMFEKNKGLFGILGVLFVALGATVVMKKRIAKKEQGETENIEEDYNPNEWEEQGLSTGNYPIYDVKTDDEGNVTDARINPLDNEFEYWVKV